MKRHEQIELAARDLLQAYADDDPGLMFKASCELEQAFTKDPTPSTERGEVEALAKWLYVQSGVEDFKHSTPSEVWDRREGDEFNGHLNKPFHTLAAHVSARIATAERRGAERAARYAWEAGNKTGLIHPVGEEDPAIRENDIRGAVEHATKGGQS